MKNDNWYMKALYYAILLIFIVIAVYPVVRVATISLRPGDRLLSTDLSLIPPDATIDNFVELFTERPFLRWVWNSTMVTERRIVTGKGMT